VWNKDLPHYDSTCDNQDDHHHVAFSEDSIDPDEYGSVTAWRTDSRRWVGFDVMLFFDVPGLAFFAWTGEYGTDLACKQRMGKWFRQVLPVAPQIDLLREEIRRYCK
jgi:hypothetical protein